MTHTIPEAAAAAAASAGGALSCGADALAARKQEAPHGVRAYSDEAAIGRCACGLRSPRHQLIAHRPQATSSKVIPCLKSQSTGDDSKVSCSIGAAEQHHELFRFCELQLAYQPANPPTYNPF